MYKIPKMAKTSLRVNESVEGRSIEEKLYETIYNKEPIDNTVGAKAYNERKDGVIASRDIRTDKFEIAAEGMAKAAELKRSGREKRLKDLQEKENPKTEDGKPEPTQGKTSTETN